MSSLFDLTGKIVLLTGAGGHLGSAMAWGLARAGAHVLLNGRTEVKIAPLAEKMAKEGLSVSLLPFDVTDEGASQKALEEVARRHDALHGIIHNAYLGKAATVQTDTAQNFDSAYHLSVTSAFRLTQQALPLLEKAAGANPAGASVLHVASMYASVSPNPKIYGNSGQNNPPHYGAAKAGLLQLTRYLACHLAPQRIRVNAISPGPFPAGNLAESQPDFHEVLCSKVPMGRIGQPEELVGAVVFLLSDAASFITGVNLPVDGGWTAW